MLQKPLFLCETTTEHSSVPVPGYHDSSSTDWRMQQVWLNSVAVQQYRTDESSKRGWRGDRRIQDATYRAGTRMAA